MTCCSGRYSGHGPPSHNMINAQMRIEIKSLGIVTRFNGVNIHQTRDCIKISCKKCLKKMLLSHKWLDNDLIVHKPTPLPSDSNYIQQLEQATPPATYLAQKLLQDQLGFSYRQLIGEILYPMVKCQPDIALQITKFSQYSANPTKEHYEAVRHICQYLSATQMVNISGDDAYAKTCLHFITLHHTMIPTH
jgi:hypothetical protein